MKRFLSFVLAMALLISLVPVARAYDTPAVTSNLDNHWYVNAGRWATPIYSYLAYEDGHYLRVEYVGDELAVEKFNDDYEFISGQSIPLELPIFGGARIDKDYNFVVTGNTNYEESDETEVFRITRYTKDWQKVDHASIYGGNTIVPFDAGSLRFDRSGDILYIRTSHEMYTSEDGLNHQSNVMIAVRVSDMTVTDSLTKVWNSSYGYVSHSFNQFVRVDGSTLLAVDHGDYYPRSVALFKYAKSAGSETFYSRTTMVNVLNIVNSTYSYNDTGVAVGGFECSSSHYLVAGSSYHQKETADLMEVQQNIFVTVTPKDNFTDEATTIRWLTNYSDTADVRVSPPHLLKLGSDSFFLTWTEDGILNHCFLDGSGNLVGEIHTSSNVGELSDCQPILADNQIVWYVTNYSEPVFYVIDLNDQGTVTIPHICDCVYAVKTAPTFTATGLLVGTCSMCGKTNEVVLPVLNTDDYSMEWIKEVTCTDDGTANYIWNNTTYGRIEITAIVPATGHNYTSKVTAPTCEEQGYTTHTCTNCGYSFKDTYTAATGHSYTYQVTKTPTASAAGTLTGTCGKCSGTTTVTLPKLSTTDYSYTVTKAATCTTAGSGRYTWKTTTYGNYAFDVSIAATGHSYQSVVTPPTCTEQGYTTHTCSVCGDSYTDAYTAATGHSYAYQVTKTPTASATGTLTGTCGKCSVTTTVTLPKLSTADYTYSVVNAATCTAAGTGRYTWKTTTYGSFCFDVPIPATGHNYTAVVTAPTCTEQGYTTHTCTNCGDSYKDTYTPATGHNYESVVVDPTCEEQGYTSHACGKCGDVFTDSYIPALGHDWEGLTCRRCGKVNMPFVDVPDDAFFYKPVIWAVEQGITNGYGSADTFAPDVTCNRGQVVTFLWRAAGEPEPSSSVNPFTDIKESDYFYKAVLWAVEEGITAGYGSDTIFNPNGSCTRGQVATFLWRYFGQPQPASTENPFNDVKSSEFYYTAVLWAAESGITAGYGNAYTFAPNMACNRGQVVTFLYRAMN